ncbi:transglycosylase SLT domain-containing protein [Acetobacter nitrogenifigens]|uniref:Lytic transglycosylase n=1 Tax=Acetobacter nitrogenifigens DSM 23921 = NBRC 105050 TaxID=1120919 RepID=A0A511XC05_9PROT|nr:transglycosylase SLT domain-containing protein [Acetobacter nitrogenifigens]GEN60401.1 lytic transglycosylase [Acetobacter nitrogenifigens DSM 23921 = NBRC 105050]
MRVIGQFSQNVAVRVLLAGAALLTGASATARASAPGSGGGADGAADAESGARLARSGEQYAMAIPRFAAHGGDDAVALPRPLSSDIATLVRSIFRLQRQGAFSDALAATTRLTDSTLLGDILAERYLNPAYHPTALELRQWLHANADMADAPAVFARLSSMPDHGALPSQPSSAMLGGVGGVNRDDPFDRAFTRNPLLDRTVVERATQGVKGARSAIHLVSITPGMTAPYAAQLGGEVAQLLLSQGHGAEALEMATDAFVRGDGKVGFPAYVAGLAAWALDRKADAAPFFETASRAPLATPELKSAAAFWAARTHRELGEDSAFRPWLQRALTAPNSLYGLLARRMLDRAPRHSSGGGVTNAALETPVDDAPVRPVLTEIDVEAVAATPIGKRVFALLQVGEQERAENAFRRYWTNVLHDTALARSMRLVAEAAGLNDLALEMEDSIQSLTQAADQEAPNLPLPSLHPRHGFTVDPALVYALTRLESNFKPGAVSGAGAHGLMQLQPVTAGFVTGDAARFTAAPEALHDPGLNLEIGQTYVRYLAHLTASNAASSPDGGDLIRLLASYNAGPGAIGRWEASSGAATDPLLYMERLPNPETRVYVSRALSYLWIYADRMNLPTPSLEALVRGEWPAFAAEQTLATARGRAHLIH